MKHRRPTDDGYATAEAAVVLPSLVLVLMLAVALVAAVGTELGCVDAAREGARQVSRGETDATARTASLAVAPRDATVSFRHHSGWVQVEVKKRLRPWHLMPALTLRATARAEEEP